MKHVMTIVLTMGFLGATSAFAGSLGEDKKPACPKQQQGARQVAQTTESAPEVKVPAKPKVKDQ